MRARAVEHFSWDDAGRRIVDIYGALIGDNLHRGKRSSPRLGPG
jgi:hypothetical protein